ncbi:MAG: hypothetical protein Roseis2KO_07140 [Roseivirga sp.]
MKTSQTEGLIESCEDCEEQLKEFHKLILEKRRSLHKEFIGTTILTILIMSYLLTRKFYDGTELNLLILKLPKNYYTDAIGISCLAFFNYRLMRLNSEIRANDRILGKLTERLFDKLGGKILAHFYTPFTALKSSILDIQFNAHWVTILIDLIYRLPFFLLVLSPFILQVAWTFNHYTDDAADIDSLNLAFSVSLFFITLMFVSQLTSLLTVFYKVGKNMKDNEG